MSKTVNSLLSGGATYTFGNMKIALLHNSTLPPKTYGGIERIVMSLAKEYQRQGHSVVLYCKDGSQTGFEFKALPVGYSGEELSSDFFKDIDFLHSHQPLHFEPSIPFLVTIHGNGHEAEKYWPNTNFLSQSHARNHHAKHYIYNGVDLSHYPFVEKKEDFFVFLAKTTWRVKNLKTAIALANDLKFTLQVMGGSGRSTRYVKYNGLTDENKKLQLLSKAKALIYPTNWDEPCAAAPLEALACGTPVITTPNGCMPELVKPGTGFVCSTYQGMKDAVENIDQISQKNCRQSVEKFFSLERMAQDYLNMMATIQEKGSLDHQPRYQFNSKSVQYVFKPTSWNQIVFGLRGKI